MNVHTKILNSLPFGQVFTDISDEIMLSIHND